MNNSIVRDIFKSILIVFLLTPLLAFSFDTDEEREWSEGPAPVLSQDSQDPNNQCDLSELLSKSYKDMSATEKRCWNNNRQVAAPLDALTGLGKWLPEQ